MFSTTRLVALGSFLAVALAHADTVNLVTSAVTLGANDTVNWSQLGADGATVPNPFAATSTGARTLSGAFGTPPPPGGIVAKVCAGCTWGAPTGDFSNNDFTVWSFDNGTSSGTGPVTLTFAAGLSGVGAVVQSDAPGLFTVKLELFDAGNASLGSVTRTSNIAGDALFIGALDITAPNARKAVFSLTAGPNNGTPNFLGDFATGPLSLNAPALAVPDLTITKTHVGNFTQGQVGATYTITASNVGTGPTVGTVTVVDTVPAFLTPTAAVGAGWACGIVAQVVTCTTNTVEPAAMAFPAITLTVTVSPIAPASVTNSVTVSGGGETNLANDTATDPTTINPPSVPDLTIAKTHVGNFTQGQVGATYTITPSNVGSGPTVGTVTVVDTVPAGLTPTGAAGTGWACGIVAQVVTCTTNTVEPAATAFPAITLTVTVAANAPALVTNTATVSGGGETNLANDTATDPTTINAAAPDLSIAKTHVGAFTQGQIGAIYTITVNNTGTGPTTGITTMTDTLPAGLTYLNGTGGGFTCSAVAQVVTCTNPAAIAAGASSVITLSVNVAANAISPVINTAAVANPNIVADPDDTVTDPTVIVPPSVLDATYQLRYLANLGQGDSYVNFTNAGTLNGFDPAGRICVNVYTFDPAEELISCCACPVTPNGLNSLSARNDLISNTLTPGVPTAVTVKLLSSLPLAGNTCNAASPTAANLVRGMRAWATTLHLNTAAAPPAYQNTETPFSVAELSASELSKLTGFCSFIQSNGSGFGICKSCRNGALGGEQK